MNASQTDAGKVPDAVAESCGSAAVPGSQRQLLQQHGFIADAGSVVSVQQNPGKLQANTDNPSMPSVQRSPLQEANRDISAHPVQVSQIQGSSAAGSKVSVSQQQSTAAFKEKHLRQMRAANERLERTRQRGVTFYESENSETKLSNANGSLSSNRPSSKREVRQTHVNLSAMVTESRKRDPRSKPSTEEVLRAASLGHHGAAQAQASRVPRASSVARTASEASKKTVYAKLQSPDVQRGATGVGVPEQGKGPEVAKGMGEAPHAPISGLQTQVPGSQGDAFKRPDVVTSTDSHRKSQEIPKGVAALANRFEAKAGSNAMHEARRQATPPRRIPMSKAAATGPSATHESALPKAPSSLVRTSSCEDVVMQHIPQDKPDDDDNIDATSSTADNPVPTDPRLHRKHAKSAPRKVRAPDASTAFENHGPPTSTLPTGSPSQRRIPTPAGLHSGMTEESVPVKQAAPLHAVAFGSPMPGNIDVCNEPPGKHTRNSMMTMSCNVNMASPTAAECEIVSAWKQPDMHAPVAQSEQGNIRKMEELPQVDQAGHQPGSHSERPLSRPATQTRLAAKERVHNKPSGPQAAAASPPTRAAFARLSDACTSPVDSLWRPLKKALVPKAGHEDDALTTNLLAPDGSPALPTQNFAPNSPYKSPAKARPATAHVKPHRPATAGTNKSRPSTAGSARTGALRNAPPENASENDACLSEAGSDGPSGLLNTGPDRLHSAGSCTKNGLEPALSRGALEMSAAHLRGSVVNDEPFVDFMGVHVDSTYLKSGRSGASSGSGCCSIM